MKLLIANKLPNYETMEPKKKNSDIFVPQLWNKRRKTNVLDPKLSMI